MVTWGTLFFSGRIFFSTFSTNLHHFFFPLVPSPLLTMVPAGGVFIGWLMGALRPCLSNSAWVLGACWGAEVTGPKDTNGLCSDDSLDSKYFMYFRHFLCTSSIVSQSRRRSRAKLMGVLINSSLCIHSTRHRSMGECRLFY